MRTRFGIWIILLACVEACGGSTTTSGQGGGNDGGGTCHQGDTKPADDGCNTCTCEGDGTWACTLLGCIADCSASKPCGAGQYCMYNDASCGTSGTTGYCTAMAQACDEIYEPVCGCDGKTYGNACSAAAAGVSQKSTGACDASCPNGAPCPPASMVACGARAGDTCMPTEYCAYEAGAACGAADAESTCKPRPQTCFTTDNSLVCGCDQKTYANACTAAIAGTGVYAIGPCAASCNGPCPMTCVEGDTMTDRCNTCTCSGGGWTCTQRACPPPTPCGGFAPSSCAATEYCAYQVGQNCGATDASATCMARPPACSKEYAPVCGCDGKTYDNACVAAVAGTGVNTNGPCP